MYLKHRTENGYMRMRYLTVSHILQETCSSSLPENPSSARTTLYHDVGIPHADDVVDSEQVSAAPIKINDDAIALPEALPAKRTLILSFSHCVVPDEVELQLIKDYFLSCGDVEICARQDGDLEVR